MIEVKPESVDSKKRHLHIGALIIAIILIFILFKVNVEKAVNSPQFQTNVTYIEAQTKVAWSRYIAQPALYIWNNLFSDWLRQGIQNINTTPIDQNTYDRVVQPDKVKKYFGVPSEEYINQFSTPAPS